MKYLLIIIFSFLLTFLYGQEKSKKLIEVLESEETPDYIFDRTPGCGMARFYQLEKKTKDSLQIILNNQNQLIIDKDYIYLMDVFEDGSYELVKQYKFTNWYTEHLFNTRVLEQSANPSLKKIDNESIGK